METNESLRNLVAKLREKIAVIHSRGEDIGEQNTKAVLIDPLLSVLGWDTQELSEVRREYRHKTQDNPVDYALFVYGSPRLFIEAKSLGVDAKDYKWISQVLGYATVVGVEWCVVTNGDEYRLYNAHAAVEVEQKLFRAVRISDLDSQSYTVSTLDLLSKSKMDEKLIDVLWKSHFVDQRVTAALDALFGSRDKALINLVRSRCGKLTHQEVKESLERASVKIGFPEIPVPHPGPSKGKAPEHKATSGGQVQVIDLVGDGFIVAPLRLEKTYHGILLEATVQSDGSILFGGKSFASLSTAAGMARSSVIGPPADGSELQPTNGWTFWQYRHPSTGALEQIDAIRQRYLANRAD